MTDSTVRHEVTHTKQIIEMGIIFYYLWYVIEWLIRLLITTERCFNIDGLITYNY